MLRACPSGTAKGRLGAMRDRSVLHAVDWQHRHTSVATRLPVRIDDAGREGSRAGRIHAAP